MSQVTYKPAEVLHWFDMESKRTSELAKKKGQKAIESTSEDLLGSVKGIASAALSYGRGAVGGIMQKQASETQYDFHESGLEYTDLTKVIKIDYDQMRKLVSKDKDRFEILYNGGSFTIKPVAHLMTGRYKVPVGWIRNGMEVPYMMLIEELSARTGLEIEAE